MRVLLAIILVAAFGMSSVVQAGSSKGSLLTSLHAEHGQESGGTEQGLLTADAGGCDASVTWESSADTTSELPSNDHCCICTVHGIGIVAPDGPGRFTRMWRSVRPTVGMADFVPAGFITEALPEPPRHLA